MEYFVSEAAQEIRNGSEKAPFVKINEVFSHIKANKDQKIDYKIFLNSSEGYKEVSKAQIKKAKTTYLNKMRKGDANDASKLDIKNVTSTISTLTLNASLLEPLKIKENFDISKLNEKRINIDGFVQNIRKQSKNLWFISLRTFAKHVQCVFEKQLCNSVESPSIIEECTVSIWGTVKLNIKEDDYEIFVDYFKVLGTSVAGGIESILNVESDVETKFDNRDMMIRGISTSKIIILQDTVSRAFRRFFVENSMYEAFPPTLVQSQCEGGATLFKLDYFGEESYLTQSSQMYLETVAPVTQRCFTFARSYRAEKSRTRRHLAEFTHVEGELCFINFEDLLDHIEDMLVKVSEYILEMDGKNLLEINPAYKSLKKPFKRMTYEDAIEWLREHDIRTADDKPYEFGDDIPESAERRMLDIIGEVVMLTRFPVEIKAFYMSRCKDDKRVTESVDVLMPGVGEIVGGSMRINDSKELLAAYKRENLDPANYEWYTRMREYGGASSGGYGLGFERFLTWALARDHIREVCLYPRHVGRCKP